MRYESDYYAYNPYNPATTLKQHGIIGQKWGVWNEETRARRLRERRGRASKVEIGGKVNPFSKLSDSISKKTQEYKEERDRKVKEDEQKRLKRAEEIKKQLEYEEKVKNAPVKHMVIHDNWSGNDWDVDVRQAFEEDLNEDNLNLIVDAFGIKADDLVIETGTSLPGLYRKDGKNFKFKYVPWNETFECADLFDFAWEGDWPMFMVEDPITGEDKIDTTKLKLIHSDSSNSYRAIDSSTAIQQEGVKGMKWGVWNEETRARRLRERRGHTSKVEISGSRPGLLNKITDRFNKPKEEPHLKRTHLTKELADISDAELNAAIKRMQLEQTYLQMLKNYPTASDRGQKYANQFSDELFKNLTTGLGGAMGKKIAKAIDDWINDDSSKEKELKEKAKKLTNEQLKADNTREGLENQWVKNRLNDKK